ncbi:hypothetical protein OPV22_030297 [Ensete ventricosum]|uniref:Growth-regulating factor n=1 Tax=Ensete ventricosum TaxID=4639 RepID=A0AAV8PZT9_ENSVE|nr:hypothetical protein OPV22_030297 [Ensete ventricosum]
MFGSAEGLTHVRRPSSPRRPTRRPPRKVQRRCAGEAEREASACRITSSSEQFAPGKAFPPVVTGSDAACFLRPPHVLALRRFRRRVFPMAGERRSQPLQREEEEGGESSPRKLARILSDEAGMVTMAAPSPLMLGLGLGLGRVGTSKPVFTFMQLQELEHQALIYKYMAAGLPVPVHLVLPIWKSVAASSFGHYCYPSLMGYGSLCLDYGNIMEPEPGRCRRTDGKKWRCSRDVVPNQKYCERHMHRGRNRPRKPVEAGATTPIAATPTQLFITVPAVGRQLTTDANAGGSGGSRASPPGHGLSHARVLRNDAAA